MIVRKIINTYASRLNTWERKPTKYAEECRRLSNCNSEVNLYAENVVLYTIYHKQILKMN